MSEPPESSPTNPVGPGRLPPPPPAGNAGRIIIGVLLILGGAVLALPGGLCVGLTISEGDGSVVGLGSIGAVVSALGGGMIWGGCRLAMVDRPAGPLFAGIAIVLILIALMLTVSIASSMN